MSEHNTNKKDILENELSSTFSKLNELSQSLEEFGNNNLIKNGIFHDDYADFTEFEDENGNILLIKYDTTEYEFRGNKYCTYILCNEKTGSREEGIAQIKNGQHVHIKDIDRIVKIKSFIQEKERRVKNIEKLIQAFQSNCITNEYADYKSISNIIDHPTAKATYNNEEYWLYISNKFITQERKYVVLNSTRMDVVEDDMLIDQLFDLNKYFPEEKKPNNKKPWWKKW